MLNIGWGTRIAILYIGFVALIGVMIALSMGQKVELVSEDYYDKELVFQNKIDEMNNANALSEKISHTFSNDYFLIQFPKENGQNVSGQILFFRPSDLSKDLKIDIKLDSLSKQQIALDKLSKGMYKMKISWNANNTPYYAEETIVIP